MRSTNCLAWQRAYSRDVGTEHGTEPGNLPDVTQRSMARPMPSSCHLSDLTVSVTDSGAVHPPTTAAAPVPGQAVEAGTHAMVPEHCKMFRPPRHYQHVRPPKPLTIPPPPPRTLNLVGDSPLHPVPTGSAASLPALRTLTQTRRPRHGASPEQWPLAGLCVGCHLCLWRSLLCVGTSWPAGRPPSIPDRLGAGAAHGFLGNYCTNVSWCMLATVGPPDAAIRPPGEGGPRSHKGR